MATKSSNTNPLSPAERTAQVLRDNRGHHFCYALRTQADSDKTRQISGRGNGGIDK